MSKTTTRSSFLRGIGIVQIAQGVSWIDPLGGVTPGRDRAFQWVPDAFPIVPSTIGALLILSGLLALVTVTLRNTGMLERVAFTAAMLPYTAVALIFLIATIAGTHSTGWISTISYGALAYVTYLAAGVVNPPPPPETGPIPTPMGDHT